MKIRFKKGDPRAGMVAEFGTDRASEFIESGAADALIGKGLVSGPGDAPKPAKKAAKKAKKAD